MLKIQQYQRFLQLESNSSLRKPGIQGKSTLADLVFLVDCLPLCIKGKGIDQIHHGFIRNLLQDVFNHAVRFVFHPVIDGAKCSLIEGRPVDFCTIVIGVGLKKLLLNIDSSLFPEPYGVSHADFQFIFMGKSSKIEIEQLIEFFCGKTESILHLLQSVLFRPICSHTQCSKN